ncbi:hypothetical protein [Lentzea sp.]|uniref:hypothetical protein n=1 Tax=Lentzea sp. TaxID=56099 RepID=UPI002ED3DB91
MGMFSTVMVHGLECPTCHHRGDYDVQIKFGGCAMDDLEVGDALRWGAYDYGEQGHPHVVTPGWGEPCHDCDGPENSVPGRFDVYVDDDVVTRVTWFDGRHDYDRDGTHNPNTEFIVLDGHGSRSVAARNDPSMWNGTES